MPFFGATDYFFSRTSIKRGIDGGIRQQLDSRRGNQDILAFGLFIERAIAQPHSENDTPSTSREGAGHFS